MKRIATKLHQLLDLVGDEAAELTGCAHYVIDATLLEMMSRTDVQQSVNAVVEADVAHLPFNPCLIEFEVLDGARRFVFLSEQGASFRIINAALYKNRMATLAEKSCIARLAHGQIELTGAAGNDREASALGVAIALLLINTRGVERDVINPVQLNRARVRKGETQIPTHTLLRIGTVYSREGRPALGHRRQTRVHLRHGHCRNQVCGENWQDRKLIYIPPTLVNYSEGAAEPVLRPKVVAK